MNPGLTYLLQRSATGRLRHFRRRLKTFKGAALFAAGLLMILILVLPQVLIATHGREMGAEPRESHAVRLWGPFTLLLVIIPGLFSTGGLYFRPAEIDFLFPAPVSRRELLLYHILGRLQMTCLSTLWMSLFLLRFSGRWYYGLAALFIGTAFLQFVTELSGLLFSAIDVRMTRWAKRLAFVALLALLGGGILVAKGNKPADASLAEVARGVLESPAVRVLSAPTKIYVEAFTATSREGFLFWAGIGTALLLAMVLLMMVLDVAYTEGSLRHSRAVQSRLQKMRSGGGAFANPGRKLRVSLPSFPRLGGAGPLAWRQTLEMVRNSRGLILLSLVMGTVLLPQVIMGMGRNDPGGQPFVSLMFLIFLTTCMTQNFAFDFRRDIDRMAYLKSLPVPAWALAAGQILPSTVLFTLLQTLWMVVIMLLSDVPSASWHMELLLFLPPVNWLATAADNSLFLVMPHRLGVSADGRWLFQGRILIILLLKVVILVGLLGISFSVGFFFWSISGESIAAGAIGAALVTLLLCVPATWVVARLFVAFDITKDVPG